MPTSRNILKNQPKHHKKTKEEVLCERKRMFEYLQDHARGQNAIIADIQSLLRPIKERSLMLHIFSALASIAHRDESDLLEGVASPMRQLPYLIDLYYATANKTNREDVTDDVWKRLTTLLNEAEMSYFFTISGYDEQGHDAQKEKTVSLATFIQSYSNPRYAYDEQVLERIQRHFAPFEADVVREYGFSPDDMVTFLVHVEYLYNRKWSDCILQWATYISDRSQWRELTKSFDARGVPPEEWGNQPELRNLVEFRKELGSIFLQPTTNLYDIDMPHDKIDAMLAFLTYHKNQVGQKSVWYTESREYTEYPFIQLGNDYLCPVMKFSAEAVYDRLNEFMLAGRKKDKYVASKAKDVEKKVVEVLDKLFAGKGKRFTGYALEPNTEQDILYVYDGYCFIVEVKDYALRSPRINPYQSYTRINDDFKRSIQKGFEQCRRVEKALMGNEDVTIYDSPKCNKIAGVIKSKDVKDCFTIIVTRDTYAFIQTDLSNLLQKEENVHYPWSVSIDDLEVMILLLKKLKGDKAADAFSEYLDFRERYHGHLLCFDELELGGFYFVNKKNFMRCADDENPLVTNVRMSQILDAHYACGLGFDNELNMDVKKDLPLPPYEKNFKVRKSPNIWSRQ